MMKKIKGNIKIKTPYKGVFIVLILLLCAFFLRSVLRSDQSLDGQKYIKKLEAEILLLLNLKL